LKDFERVKINFRKKYLINEQFILFVGRFNKVKGIDVLIHALNLMKKDTTIMNLKLIIMGVDFGFENEMFKMIKDMNLEKIIKVIKNPPREDVIAAYSECEFLVLPSRWELSPLTHLEGFTFKKTVISTKVHGIPSTVKNNENAILINSDDPKELAESIQKLQKNSKLKMELGMAGYNLVHNECNSKLMAKNVLDVYNDVVSK